MNRPLTLDDTLKARLADLANRTERTEDQLLQEAVRYYLDRADGRAGFLAEAEQSWLDYQADGQHLTGAEARAWLQSWGTPHEKAPPECHD
ncbi:CopG family ribbon-helix-helix protein [Rhizobium rhizophilum]|uniref:CopG family transcriptional regulator n=1 Tax=Rhizobium rhizophilum TaxID=1850373 RepID=A0ABY2QUY9_9HYPH|nr:CopG family transcriptional regulator [Rhizobium rhizophilum]THV14279.1 CopG family transcriptional regulator [Rhizobium rhizophilum]